MDCPVCSDSAMITLELNEVEVDYCLECKGIWLDEGELELLLDSPQQSSKLLDSFVRDDKIDEQKRKCPICLKKMIKISVGDQAGKVTIDKCPKNHGLWFDKGELDDIVDKAELDEDNRIKQLLREMFNN